MRRRRVDSHPHEFDGALRGALHMAVDSLEPGADGIDQIRAKIAARQAAHRGLGWLSTAARGTGRSWWRALLPPRGWFPAVAGAVVERFRPDPNRAGWFGWLRPAAAVTTGLFVVTAAAAAVAALPSVIDSGNHPRGASTSVAPTKTHGTSVTGQRTYPGTTGGGTTPTGSGSRGSSGSTGPSTPSCTPTGSGTPSVPATGTPSPSGSTSQSGSPSPSNTTSDTTPSTPTVSATTPAQPTPTGQPTPGADPASPAPAIGSAPANAPGPADSPAATGKALLSPDAMTPTRLDGVSGMGESTVGASDGTPAPTASPTVGGTPPPTSSPPPPPPC